MHMPPVDRLPHWRFQTGEVQIADAAATGAPAAVPPLQAPHAIESMERLGHGAVPKTPDAPSAAESPNRDWTETELKAEDPEPPEPIAKQLLEFLQSMWRASGSVIDVAQDVEKTALAERLAQQAKNEPLTYSDYSDPKVRRSGGV